MTRPSPFPKKKMAETRNLHEVQQEQIDALCIIVRAQSDPTFFSWNSDVVEWARDIVRKRGEYVSKTYYDAKRSASEDGAKG